MGLRRAGATSLHQIVDALNARGITTPRGGKWYAKSVSNVLARARSWRPLHCFWLVEGPPPEILEFFAAARKKFWSKACTHACAAAGEVAFKIKVRALA
jgi:hypothetical protein